MRQPTPSSSSSNPHAASGSAAPAGLIRTTSKTLEEARRLVLGNQDASSSDWPAASNHSWQGFHDDKGFDLHRDSAQHPLVEARRAVLEEFERPASP